MAKVHHATAKKAAEAGLVIIATEDGFSTDAFDGVFAKATDAVSAGILAKTIKAEYAGLRVEMVDAGQVTVVSTMTGETIWEGEEGVPTLADVLDAATELDIDPEEGPEEEEEEEEKAGGSVVPLVYKIAYEANGGHCGDWLATVLADVCRRPGPNGKGEQLDIDAFTIVLEANGLNLQTKSWAHTRSNGWQGRFRMTGRNVLTGIVARKGTLYIPSEVALDGQDATLTAPEAWMLKHAPKAKAKSKKAVAAAVEAPAA